MKRPGPVDYSLTKTPKAYKCSACGVKGCKLWRQYNTFLSHINLMCCDCGGENQSQDVSGIDSAGRIESLVIGEGHRTDQIGWLIPAVPDEEGNTYWGYSSVPKSGCDWWRRLPTRGAKP